VNLSQGLQIYPDRSVRGAIASAFRIDNLFTPDDRVAAIARRAGFRVLSLARDFQRIADRTGVFLHGFPPDRLGVGHWNAAGHREAGRRIARVLCTAILPTLRH